MYTWLAYILEIEQAGCDDGIYMKYECMKCVGLLNSENIRIRPISCLFSDRPNQCNF